MLIFNLVIILVILIAYIAACYLVCNNISLKPQKEPQRQLSQAEILAKSMQYWEELGKNTDDSSQKHQAVDGMRYAMSQLLKLQQHNEPTKANRPSPLPDGVIDINSSKKPS